MTTTTDCKTLSIPEAGRIYFGLSRNGSYEAAKRGELPVLKVGGKYRVPIVALEKMLDFSSPPLADPTQGKLRVSRALIGDRQFQYPNKPPSIPAFMGSTPLASCQRTRWLMDNKYRHRHARPTIDRRSADSFGDHSATISPKNSPQKDWGLGVG